MSGPSFIQVTTVQVSARSEWDPYAAQQIVHSLFAQHPPLTLLIRARRSRIAWQIESLAAMQEMVAQTFYSVYPQAQISSDSKHSADVGYYAFAVEAGAPFFVPLAFASELKPMDPLPALLTPMAGLEEGEEVVFSLALHPPSRDYQKLGNKQITRSGGSLLRFVFPIRGLQSALYQAALGGERQSARYVSDIQHVAEQKVRQPVKEVELAVKVRTDSQERAHYLFETLLPALAWYNRPGMNALIPAIRGSYRLVLSVLEIAALWHLLSHECRLPGIDWSTHSDVPLPVIFDKVEEGLRLGSSTFQKRISIIRLPHDDRNTHVNLIGRTRMGKSTLMHNMVHQDILAGHGVAVIDPHGDLVEDILHRSIPADREQDVVLFDLNEDQRTIGLNLLVPIPDVPLSTSADLALTVLSKFFGEDWRGGRLEDTLMAAILSLMHVPDTVLLDIPRLFNNEGYRKEVLDQLEDPVALDYWHNEFQTSSVGQQRELARPINHRMRALYREKRMRRIIGSATCLDFDDILEQNRILLVNLRGSQTGTGSALGSLILTKLQTTAMGRAEGERSRRTVF